ncbi:hypothetical protein EDB92DRAFT_1815195 [Lactarius akahatsu]|uniref:Uncharacterized protein n=1 Tax=Lactarius akahatsu TaxID=416441 RepID=A0AAD4LIU2_9AGAM|nr:hypothetical protein EDB92DRAFT_1815195 [Lactarius akahatsu]
MDIKDVNASYDALGDLLELIENFLRRLNICTKVQSTTAMTETVVKILVELLATLALAIQQVKRGRLKGTSKVREEASWRKDVEALLQKLDRLTQVESRTTAALTLDVVHTVVKNMGEVTENEKALADDIRQILCDSVNPPV